MFQPEQGKLVKSSMTIIFVVILTVVSIKTTTTTKKAFKHNKFKKVQNI